MHMHALDWSIVAGLLVVLFLGALRTRKYTRSVSAFLAAERCGGRYLISMANAMAGLGVISLVYWFEIYYEAGYTAYWWGAMTEPALVILALSGWVIYRFRQTRAMTLAQFFEMRYSRNFRVFAGLVAYLSGIINFGIFPAVGARFFIALCGLPDSFAFLGANVSTFAALMAGLLSVSLLFTFLGGHIAVMVTDYLQGVFANIVFAIIIFYLLYTLRWDRMTEAMLMAPAERSLVHPFHIGEQSHFNIWYFLISVVVVFYGVLGWQGAQGYNCCAKDAHEAKMAGILNGWRFRVLLLIAIVVPIGVRTVLYHPDFAEQAAVMRQSIESIQAGDDAQRQTLQTQLRTPYALAVMLPSGLLGMMCAAMLAAFISTHDTYLHSWGSIFVQDVILPFRKKPFNPQQHLWLLRASIFGVAAFIFLFSLLFRQTQFIAMFLAITGAIFVGGAGSVIIGGLYWKRGTTAGAWAAMLTGMLLSLAGIVLKQIWPDFFLTGQEMTFCAIAASVGMYVIVSLLGGGAAHNMDRLLHRGKYAVAGESSTAPGDARTWLEKLGVDREFTGWDRVVTYFSIGWPLIWTALFVVGTAYSLIRLKWGDATTNEGWLAFWHGYTWIIFAGGAGVTLWFTIGGIKDMRYLFRRLRSAAIDPDDDGRVVKTAVDFDDEGSAQDRREAEAAARNPHSDEDHSDAEVS
jgi:SSS family solute:Na+ symporter